MAIADAFRALADRIGLSDEEVDDLLADDVQIDLSDPLPGVADGAVEIYLAADSTSVAPKEEGKLLWWPIAREGQWALRPDGRGGKRRVPLKIIAGRSKNQQREIGLQDVVDAFQDQAVEHVTVPETHDNKASENHGYIEKLKIATGKVKDGGKDVAVKVLMGGYHITEPETKAKMLRGSVPSRSAGFLYNYRRTDTGKSYPVALEHVALTAKPWLRGMPRFGRPLEQLADVPTVSLTLSDEGPEEDEYVVMLADHAEDEDFLADSTTVAWPHETSPQWLQQQVNQILSAKRSEKLKTRGDKVSYIAEDRIPNYRCTEARPGAALICDGWGDGSNYWVAPIEVKEGEVVLDDFSKWQATKQVFVADQRKQPTGDKAPLADEDIKIDPLLLAQAERTARSSGDTVDLAQLKTKTRNKLPDSSFAIPDERKFPIHDESHARNALSRAAGTKYESRVKEAVKKRYPKIDVGKAGTTRGGGNMADDTGTLQLSEEARTAIKAAEDRAKAAEQRAENLAQTVDRLVGTVTTNETASFIRHLKAPVAEGGLGLSEERGFSGMLMEIEEALLADDGGPAVQSDHFTDDSNKTGELSVTGLFKRVFGALRTAEGSTLKLGEIVPAPTEKKDGDSVKDGKPAKGDEEEIDESKLSDDELLADDPVAKRMGLMPTSANGSGQKDGDS